MPEPDVPASGIRESACAAVIVTHNAALFIRETLEALRSQICPPRQVMVVDNASTDATVALVRQGFPYVDVESLTMNIGFSGANNLGIEHALRDGVDFVLLLNQDAVLHPAAIEYLVREAARRPEFGLLGAFQLSYDGTAVDEAFAAPAGLLRDLESGSLAPVYSTPFVPAVAVLLRREALFDVGGFDPLFFMYHEDQDLCRRLIASRWEVGVVPRAIVKHWNGSTHARRSWRWERNWAFSDAVLHLKWSPRWFPIAYLSLVTGWIAHGHHNLRRTVGRALALARCVVMGRRIWRHRTSVPYTFRREEDPRTEMERPQ